MKRIIELDGLRCLAILAVFAVHFRPPFNPHYWIFGLGWLGVDLFFAISGFLITSILLGLRQQSNAFRTFYARRTLRIFPPYYLVLGILLSLGLAGLGSVTLQDAWTTLTFTYCLTMPVLPAIMGHLSGHMPFGNPPVPIDNHIIRNLTEVISIFWSLSVEELFYVIWAPIVLLGSKRVIVIFCFVPLLVCPVLRLMAHTASYRECFNFVTRADALTAGACVALALQWSRRGHIRADTLRRFFFCGVAGFGICFCGLAAWTGALRGIEIRSLPIFALLGYSFASLWFSCIVGAVATHVGHPILAPLRLRVAVYIGTISYTMYLIHAGVFVAVHRFQERLAGGSVLPGLRTAGITIPAVIALASLSWFLFEKPILALKDRWFRAARAQLVLSDSPVPVSTEPDTPSELRPSALPTSSQVQS